MNKSQIFWGVICLLIAAVLAVLNLTLPPESLMFQIGDRNMPWVPPVVFAGVGVVLLLTAGKKEEPTPPAEQLKPGQDPEKKALNQRLESVAWGLFLIMLGGFALVPDNTIPKGAWSIGIGVIMLGLNAARYFSKIKMSGFTTVLGIIALLGGVAELIGITSLDASLLLIILGAYLILKPWFEKHKIFGKAEQAD